VAGYPPSNIERTAKNAYRISWRSPALARTNSIRGNGKYPDDSRRKADQDADQKNETLTGAIAARTSSGVFQLADYVHVTVHRSNTAIARRSRSEFAEAQKARRIASAMATAIGRGQGSLTRSVHPRSIMASERPGPRGAFCAWADSEAEEDLHGLSHAPRSNVGATRRGAVIQRATRTNVVPDFGVRISWSRLDRSRIAGADG